MSGTIAVWNVTPATKETPIDLHIYGKVIRPGTCVRLDASWVRQYPKPLTSAETSKTVHVGEALPQWYDEALEEQMKKITHKGQAPSILSGEGFHPTEVNPGDSFELEDEVVENLAEALEKQSWLHVEDVEDEETEEGEPKKKASGKKRNIRRKKKDG